MVFSFNTTIPVEALFNHKLNEVILMDKFSKVDIVLLPYFVLIGFWLKQGFIWSYSRFILALDDIEIQ